MPYIVGSRLEAYCMVCRGDQVHIIMEMAGTRIRTVKCEKCQTDGDFRTPRERAKAAIMQFAKKKRTSRAPKSPGRSKKASSPKAMFERLIDGMDLSSVTPYNIKAPLKEGELIEHPSFGIGVVTSLVDAQKAKVFFQDGERVMICNRK